MKSIVICLLIFATFIDTTAGTEGICSASNLSPLEKWLCNLDKWILSWEEWINLVKDDCYPAYFIQRWFEMHQNTHRVSSIQEDCFSPQHLTCEKMTDGRKYCYCRDGSYKDQSSLIKVWKRNRNFLNYKVQIFNDQFRRCMKWNNTLELKQTGSSPLQDDDRWWKCQLHLPFDSWMCKFPEWIKSGEKWKELLKNNCKSGKLSVISNIRDCPTGVERQYCLHKQYHVCESEQRSCGFCYCKNGMYHRSRSLFLIWQKGQVNFQKRLNLYQKSLKKCASSRLTTTKYNISKTQATVSESSHKKNESNLGNNPNESEKSFRHSKTWPNCSSACNDVIDGSIPNQPVGFALKGTVAKIFPNFAKEKGVNVYCDCTPGSDKAWTVFQRRMDGSVSFFRNWTNYTEGFGDPGGEFWLGLDLLHLFTRDGDKELRVDLGDKKKRKFYAGYRHFTVGDSETQYTLSIGDFHGNELDALGDLNGTQFHTPDFGFAEFTYIGRPLYYFDEDIGDYAPYPWPYRQLCSERVEAGWWFIDYNYDHDYYGAPNYHACAGSILNGRYGDSLYWTTSNSLTAAEMKFRDRS